MAYSVSFGAQFLKEYANYQPDQQASVTSFIKLYRTYGLGDFSKFPGKVSPSWKGAQGAALTYALDNDLWHYHVGLPQYKVSPGGYQTSDWVLHFQWPKKGLEIRLVDLCYHYTSTGQFYMPTAKYLVPHGAEPRPPSNDQQ